MSDFLDDRGENITQLLREGESEFVEFKARLGNEESIAQTVVAFANSRGGYIFFGVNDEGRPVGLFPSEAESISHRFLAMTASLLARPIQTYTINQGGLIVFAYIPPAPEHLKPVTTATGKAYTRRGTIIARWPQRRSSLVATRPQRVFVAMSFRTEEEPALVDYFGAIQRAVAASTLPIELVRIDLVEGDYEISQEIMNQIDSCDFVIADFTLSPANVYFEVGYARGRKKGIIQIARKDTTLEFDVRNWRTHLYRNATELEEGLIPRLTEAYYDVQESD